MNLFTPYPKTNQFSQKPPHHHHPSEHTQNRKTNTSVVSFLRLNSSPPALCCQLCSIPHGGTGPKPTAPFVNQLSVTALPSAISACPKSSSKFEISPKYLPLAGTGQYHSPPHQWPEALGSACCALDSSRQVLAHQADAQPTGDNLLLNPP